MLFAIEYGYSVHRPGNDTNSVMSGWRFMSQPGISSGQASGKALRGSGTASVAIFQGDICVPAIKIAQ